MANATGARVSSACTSNHLSSKPAMKAVSSSAVSVQRSSSHAPASFVVVSAALNGHIAPLKAAKAISAYGPAMGPSNATEMAVSPKAELYKATIGAESVKVEAFATMGSVYASKVGAQAEKARVEIAKLNARVTAKAQEWDAWKSRLAAATAQVEAAASKSAVMVDGYRAGASAAQAQAV